MEFFALVLLMMLCVIRFAMAQNASPMGLVG
jgi:hypothetical protein